jgi:hypothetical protein
MPNQRITAIKLLAGLRSNSEREAGEDELCVEGKECAEPELFQCRSEQERGDCRARGIVEKCRSRAADGHRPMEHVHDNAIERGAQDRNQ